MAKKITNTGKIEMARKPISKITTKSAVRNSPIPRPSVVAAKRVEITAAQIAGKAFEIYSSGNGGSELDNWFQAERELRTKAI